MNSPVNQALLQLVHQNVHSLENEVKNWSGELKEEREKVQQQLQQFDGAFEAINQRLLRLETSHQRLETEQQRLETGHQRLKTGLKRSRKDHERLKTKQRRWESHSRDVELRVIQCEGTPTFKKKRLLYLWEARGVNVQCFLVSPSFLVINNSSNNVLLLLRRVRKPLTKCEYKILKRTK